MSEQFEKAKLPDLKRLPSAQAHGRAAISGRADPPLSRKRRSFLGILAKVGISIISIAVIAAIGLVLLLSSGPVSNDQIRSQVETQLSSLLGDRHTARIDDTKLALGKNGLLALDATNVTILKDGNINLGVAREVAVKVKAMPLMSGSVVAESVIMRGAKLSLASFVTQNEETDWPKHIDFTALLNGLGKSLTQLEQSLVAAGLDSIDLEDADLLGFEQLGLRSAIGKISDLRLERDINFQEGLFISGNISTDKSNWRLQGSWQTSDNNEKVFKATVSGLDISDFVLGKNADATGALQLRIVAPFSNEGDAQQAVLNAALENVSVAIKNKPFFALPFGALNFRILTEKNQIELERSPLRFETTQAVLLGGLRFPKTQEQADSDKPIFQLIANDVTAYGLGLTSNNALAAFNAEGWVDPQGKNILVDKLSMNTPTGNVTGAASIGFADVAPHYKAKLKIPKMEVTDFKQFWPAFLAPGARKWANEGITDGLIENATLDVDMPPGLFGNPTEYSPRHLSAKVPLTNGSIKSIGDLPRITAAKGIVNFGGTRTTVDILDGKLNLGKRGTIDVDQSSLKIGSYTNKALPSTLDLKLKGQAQGMAALGAIKPLRFSKSLDLNPTDLSGSVSAEVSASFNLRDVARSGVKNWDAKVALKNAASRKPFQGRKIEKADLAIIAKPSRVEVTGTAVLDGVPAKLALVQKPGSNQLAESKVVLTIDDRMRSRIIGDTGKIISGPIDVVVTGNGKNRKIEANLKKARLSFPWIGWAKGKGIPGKAVFSVRENNGVTVLENFKLTGSGFSAGGRMEMDKSGLRKANLRRIRLNKTDDFDVDVARTRDGFSINLNARSYDGRALIKTFLGSNRAGAKGGLSVRVVGNVGRLYGFGGEYLNNVKVDFSQRGSRVSRAVVDAQSASGAATTFALKSESGGLRSKIKANDAGALLRFVDLYGKVRGGRLDVNLVQDSKGVFRGPVRADDFVLLNEPRLAKLLNRPVAPPDLQNGQQIVQRLKKLNSSNVKIDTLTADIVKGKGFLNLPRGRLTGGDASAAFNGLVYDQNNRMNIKGTFLPARTLNRLVSKIPIIGLAFGKGKVNGLLGITFKLTGRFSKPKIQVNPLSILAPGVFREIFKF